MIVHFKPRGASPRTRCGLSTWHPHRLATTAKPAVTCANCLRGYGQWGHPAF
jgi:hypothetical protein